MTAAAHHTPLTRRPRPSRRAAIEIWAGAVLLLGVSGGVARAFALAPAYVLRAAALYGLLGVLLLRHLPERSRGAGLGPANRVTLGRAALVLSIAALVPEARMLFDTGYWFVIALTTLALCLDGVDGWVARRTGSASAFGARFDMELDSFLMLALAALVWRSGKVGPWVICLGLPRYLFVAASWRWPPLRAPLPERFRRKAGCVLQGVVLLVCLGPIVPAAPAGALAAVTLALLLASFAMDIVWLFRQDRAKPTAT